MCERKNYMKKKISIVISIIIVLSFFIGYIVSWANNESIFVNITEVLPSGMGYGIGNPKNAGYVAGLSDAGTGK